MFHKESDWTCKSCGQLLGVIEDNRLEIHTKRGHQYRVTLPVTCVCKNPHCRTLNELLPLHAPSRPAPPALSPGQV